MGSRYLVTGTQLGLLIALCKIDSDKCNELLNEIVEKQQIGHSEQELDLDLEEARNGKSEAATLETNDETVKLNVEMNDERGVEDGKDR